MKAELDVNKALGLAFGGADGVVTGERHRGATTRSSLPPYHAQRIFTARSGASSQQHRLAWAASLLIILRPPLPVGRLAVICENIKGGESGGSAGAGEAATISAWRRTTSYGEK